MILWITGNSGVGKTTLGRCLAERYNAILLDGDVMRNSISESTDFSTAGRKAHNLRVARLAKVLESQGKMVIISVIAPYIDTRKIIDKKITPLWIYLHRSSIEADAEHPYEPPANAFIDIDTDRMTVSDMVEYVIARLEEILS